MLQLIPKTLKNSIIDQFKDGTKNLTNKQRQIEEISKTENKLGEPGTVFNIKFPKFVTSILGIMKIDYIPKYFKFQPLFCHFCGETNNQRISGRGLLLWPTPK